ncbi:MAG: MBL fold metallo-hydrolase [Clostridia bacterium]|nr:MBL fold metallo-hydrolase [Clostridia bacterium]
MVKRKYRRSAFPLWAVLLLAVLLALYLFFQPPQESPLGELPPNEIRVHFIDVGQGDCAAVESADGNILIDAGTPECEDDLLEYLEENGLTEFVYAIFTHPHSDHIGSAAAVLNACKVERVLLGNGVSTGSIYKKLLQTIDKGGQKVSLAKPGDEISLGKMKIEIFAPVTTYEDLNNSSIVFRLSYGDFSVLFTGDAEKEAETDILRTAADISADVLKVGHHGSSSSTSEKFLKAVAPKLAVISLAEDNSYGHPHKEVLRRLSKYGVEVLRTDERGSIVLTTNGSQIEVYTEKE